MAVGDRRNAAQLVREETMGADVAECFEAHRARVYRWAYGLCARHEDALDVVHPLQQPLAHHVKLRWVVQSHGDDVGQRSVLAGTRRRLGT